MRPPRPDPPAPSRPRHSNGELDDAEFRRIDRHGGLEMMSARFERHEFPRHSHPTYVIEVVDRGEDSFLCAGRPCRAMAGDIVVINPDVVHTGRPAGSSALAYKSLYPTPHFLSSACRLGAGDSSPPTWFPDPVIKDPELCGLLRAAHAALAGGVDQLHADSLLFEALGRLITRHARARESNGAAPRRAPSRGISGAREFLHARFRETVPLEQLAGMAEVSPFHFLRAFRAATGLPPHLYQQNLRVHHAKALIARGVPICRAALESGFADQSHLTRCFKRIVGTTPARFGRARVAEGRSGTEPNT